MKTSLFGNIGVVICSLLSCEGLSQTSVSLFPESVQREVKVIESVLVRTNKQFDRVLCRAIGLKDIDRASIEFVQYTFVFAYKDKRKIVPATVEVNRLHSLEFEFGEVECGKTSSLDCAANFIRLHAPDGDAPPVEFCALMRVGYRNNARKVVWVRKRFRFTDSGEWVLHDS